MKKYLGVSVLLFLFTTAPGKPDALMDGPLYLMNSVIDTKYQHFYNKFTYKNLTVIGNASNLVAELFYVRFLMKKHRL